MQTFRLIVALGLLSLAMYIVWQAVSAWRAASGSVWQRLLASAKDSATILWAKFVSLIASLAGLAGEFADAVGAPGVKEQVQSALGNPVYVALFLVGVSFISIAARKRTL